VFRQNLSTCVNSYFQLSSALRALAVAAIIIEHFSMGHRNPGVVSVDSLVE